MTSRSFAAAVFVILTVSVAGCGTPERSAVAAPSPTSAPDVQTAEQTAATSPPAATSWTMPDLVGFNLQDAQDTLQRHTAYGIAVTFSHDETGAGREQVLDRNWKVCSQNVPPGETVTAQTQIDFGAVKLDEGC